MKISFIGFGNMAQAIACGLQHENHYQLYASAPSLVDEINANGIHTHSNNIDIVEQADVIVLCVKPAKMTEVIQQIAPIVSSNCLMISVAAGVTLEWYSQYLPQHAWVRAMPNIAASIGKSATPLLANANVNTTQKATAEDIFSRIGITHWVKHEQEIDKFTALSGSGPAYAFLFMEALINAAQKLGLDEPTAKLFTLQTIQGAVALAQASHLNLSDLRKTVTSPSGTTAAALNVFTEHNFASIIQCAVDAAFQRAQELSKLP